MKPFRDLQPAAPSLQYVSPGSDHRQPQKRCHHSKEEWEQQKELVFRYYVKEKLSLEKTMAKFAAADFVAKYVQKCVSRAALMPERERTWKKKIKEWGFEKNVPNAIKRTMLEKKRERTMKGKDTNFLWGFNAVPLKRLEEFEKGQAESLMGALNHQAGW